mmetsp:Transcript_103557/g.188725  ORF Transcript_103557/g.188725 Transcript_103557/m.188725 type:complete len:207 (-) Transcript_103557:9-629(-)
MARMVIQTSEELLDAFVRDSIVSEADFPQGLRAVPNISGQGCHGGVYKVVASKHNPSRSNLQACKHFEKLACACFVEAAAAEVQHLKARHAIVLAGVRLCGVADLIEKAINAVWQGPAGNGGHGAALGTPASLRLGALLGSPVRSGTALRSALWSTWHALCGSALRVACLLCGGTERSAMLWGPMLRRAMWWTPKWRSWRTPRSSG